MTRPLRVAFCHFTADVQGGSDRSLFDLVVSLPRRAIHPLMILRHGDPLASDYKSEGIDVHQMTLIPPRRAAELAKQFAFFSRYWPSVLEIRNVLRTFQADVVHVNTINNLQGPMGAVLSRRPLVWHVRELVPGSRMNYLQRRLVARWASIPVANSNAVAESLRECGADPRVVLNGISLREFDDPADPAPFLADCPIPDGARVVTCIGRLEPWKGQHVLIESFVQVLARHPEAYLAIVGGAAVNKPEYERSLRERVAMLRLESRVCFAGIQQNIPAVLAATEVLVLPSVTPEPFGRTVVEAMAAGKPVVATRAGGPLDTLENERTGLFAQPNDAVELAHQINRVLDDPEWARAMGAEGRKVARERFSLERVVEEMAEILIEAAARKPRS